MASVFNMSTSTFQKRDRGNKEPTGASRKRLDLMERKGLKGFIKDQCSILLTDRSQ